MIAIFNTDDNSTTVHDGTGRIAAQVAVEENGDISLSIPDRGGTVRCMYTLKPNGNGSILFFDANGERISGPPPEPPFPSVN